MESNRVNVTIYGKEYTVSGDMSRERIIGVAAHVDSRMQEIGEGFNGPVSTLAVLAAVNIADDYFALKEKLGETEKSVEQLENDEQHYMQLWEEVKKSFIAFKQESQEETENITQQKEELQSRLLEKDHEIEEMLRERKKMEKELERGSAEKVRETELKYKDIENNFFDLQMENIQLKSELEKMKSRLEWEKNEREG